LLVYTSAPLQSDLEITGHPMVTLELSSTEADGAVFVYLEDVAPSGDVYYVTDGQLRLLTRRVGTAPPPYVFPAPYRTFETSDTASMQPGKVEAITLDLYPISYLIRSGHSIRVSIAGADVDQFVQISKRAPALTIARDAVRSSRIVLPVMPR
jgi:putative CocE/NonD family hydrolase